MVDEIVETPEGAEEVQVEVPAVEPITEPAGKLVLEPVVIEPPPEPKKKTAQERIDEITRARREAEREREYWKRVALEKEQAAVKPSIEPAEPSMSGRPTLDQFETTEKYEDALFSWYEQKKSSEQTIAKQKTAQEEALVKFNRAAEKLRQEHDDFDTVIETPVFSPAMRFAILQSDNGPLMAYHLGKVENRVTAERIRTLPPEAQFYEIGKLETQLLIAKNTKKVPGAPPPITPVGMAGGGGEKDTAKMSDDEWFAYEKQQRLIKLRQKTGG